MLDIKDLEGKIINADCMDILKQLPDKCIDLVLTDPPYGITSCAWDKVIDNTAFWLEINRIIKDNGVCAICGQEPFSSYLRLSNIDNYRYDYVWVKQKGTNFGSANKRPMKYHEFIHIFYKHQPIYNVQFQDRQSKRVMQAQKNKYIGFRTYGESMPLTSKDTRIDFNKYDSTKKRLGSVITCPSVVSTSK